MFAKKNRSWWRIGVFAGLAALGMEGAAVPVVSNVKMRQLEGTKTVEITYDLADKDNPFLDVSVSVTTNGVALPVKTVSGDVTKVAPGAGKRILWNAGKDWDERYTKIAEAVVSADVHGGYMVIDLSGGTAATSYSVRYLATEPEGGWTDEYKTTKLVLRHISSGMFIMGSPTNELWRVSDEVQHQVTISKPFYMGVFEVTQKQYQLVMGSKSFAYEGDTRPTDCVSYVTIRGSSLGAKWPESDGVDATSFMGKLRAKTELKFDLPTEAQWEYACRAGTTTALNSGKDITASYYSADSNMNKVGRYGDNETDGKGGYSTAHTAVGSYRPNDWGLYDMHGNVREWCLDWYGSLSTAAVADPKGASSGSARVMRGGSWGNGVPSCRSAYRGSNFSPSNFNDSYGFRLCCPAGL